MLNNVLYFPNSPVKIISLVCLGDDLDNSESTWISTRQFRSTFKWDNEKYTRELQHPGSRLPEINVNPGCSTDLALCTSLTTVSESGTTISLRTVLPKDMFDASNELCPRSASAYFAQENTNDSALDPTISTHNKVLANETVISNDFYQIGDTVRYMRNDFHGLGTVENIIFDKSVRAPTYKIRIIDTGHILETRKEFISPPDIPDIAETAISENQVNDIVKCLTREEINLLFAKTPIDPLHEEFISWHRRLGHLWFSAMFKLAKNEELPRKFLKLQDKALLCPDCIIGSMKRRSWRSKGPPGVIRKSHAEVPGGMVSVDQLVSKQPGLIPRIDGKHTLDRVSGATVYVDNYSGFCYSHLQSSLDTDQTIQSKCSFESLVYNMGVNIKAYRADNSRFIEKGNWDAQTNN